MGKLFGTDGIRGVANQYPITCEIALKTGQAVGVFTKENGYQTVIIGKDTRISGDMLESALAAGVSSTGMELSYPPPITHIRITELRFLSMGEKNYQTNRKIKLRIISLTAILFHGEMLEK